MSLYKLMWGASGDTSGEKMSAKVKTLIVQLTREEPSDSGDASGKLGGTRQNGAKVYSKLSENFPALSLVSSPFYSCYTFICLFLRLLQAIE